MKMFCHHIIGRGKGREREREGEKGRERERGEERILKTFPSFLFYERGCITNGIDLVASLIIMTEKKGEHR